MGNNVHLLSRSQLDNGITYTLYTQLYSASGEAIGSANTLLTSAHPYKKSNIQGVCLLIERKKFILILTELFAVANLYTLYLIAFQYDTFGNGTSFTLITVLVSSTGSPLAGRKFTFCSMLSNDCLSAYTLGIPGSHTVQSSNRWKALILNFKNPTVAGNPNGLFGFHFLLCLRTDDLQCSVFSHQQWCDGHLLHSKWFYFTERNWIVLPVVQYWRSTADCLSPQCYCESLTSSCNNRLNEGKGEDRDPFIVYDEVNQVFACVFDNYNGNSTGMIVLDK